MSSTQQQIVFCRLGRVDYNEAWELQKQLQQHLVANKRSDTPRDIPHVALLVEHPPVFTLGKSGDASNLLASQAELEAAGATFVRIDRGGDITYHGPGQIVGYPILDLDRFYTDIHRYLRDLEEVIIRTCADFGIEADRFDKGTGVWVTKEDGNERKLCAMGIRCSRWVTMHGFALNVSPQLDHFNMIVPCGIADRGVGSMEMELLQKLDRNEVENRISFHMGEVFGAAVTILEADDAQAWLRMYLSDKSIH
jgi:lipoyl(octanoyl) transferase